MLIDTHCHLNFPDFDNDREEVIQRAKDTQVEKIILASACLEESVKNINLAKSNPDLWAMVGLHPHNTNPKKENNEEVQLKEIDLLLQRAQQNRIVAVGEIGLDFSPTSDNEVLREKSTQISIFKKQLALADKYKLPVVIHSRNTFEEILTIIKNFPTIKKVVHCFTYSEKEAEKLIDEGCYISITGIVTFPKAVQLQKAVAKIPLDRLMLETDAPFLAPEPYRGKRNEPAYVKIIAKYIAELKNIPMEQLESAVYKNSSSFFGLENNYVTTE